MYIENVIIGTPFIGADLMFANDFTDWVKNERFKTGFSEERFLPKILVDFGIAPSINEVKRNKPELVRTLDAPDFVEVKWGKRKLWILVGN